MHLRYELLKTFWRGSSWRLYYKPWRYCNSTTTSKQKQ